MAPSCIFCGIARGDIPAKKALETDRLVAFHDIHPQAPVHILIIPREHRETINDLDDGDAGLAGELVIAARRIAADLGVAADGYRLVFNCGKNSGQDVYHIHLHLLAGRQLAWPPG